MITRIESKISVSLVCGQAKKPSLPEFIVNTQSLNGWATHIQPSTVHSIKAPNVLSIEAAEGDTALARMVVVEDIFGG